MADEGAVVINVDSPNVNVDAPVSVTANLVGDIRERITNLVDAIREGDDEVMASLLLSVGFIVVGVYLWRRV